jgi:hypothetical protein
MHSISDSLLFTVSSDAIFSLLRSCQILCRIVRELVVLAHSSTSCLESYILPCVSNNLCLLNIFVVVPIAGVISFVGTVRTLLCMASKNPICAIQTEQCTPFSYGITAHVWALYSSVLRLLNLKQTHGRTPLDKWSGLRRGLYLNRTTQHINTRDKHLCPQRDSNTRSHQQSDRWPTP